VCVHFIRPSIIRLERDGDDCIDVSFYFFCDCLSVCLHSVGSLLSIRLPPPSCLVEALTAKVENVFQKI
jgi:hypothetical protein